MQRVRRSNQTNEGALVPEIRFLVKLSGDTDDKTNMGRHNGSNDRRSVPRVTVPSDSPVYIQRNVDGIDLSLLVENLSESGAMLICPELNEPFQRGEDFGDCMLVLPGVGHAAIKTVILWAMWPKV